MIIKYILILLTIISPVAAYAGRVISERGKPIVGVQIKANESMIRSGGGGEYQLPFKLEVPDQYFFDTMPSMLLYVWMDGWRQISSSRSSADVQP